MLRSNKYTGPTNSVDQASHQLSRRELLMWLGAGIVMAAKTVHRLDQRVARERWPNDEPEILPTYGAEDIPKGGEEWLVFGGFGQKYSVNAAQELFNAIDRRQVVSSVKYPNQGFTIDDIADLMGRYIQDRGMSVINIVGVSMGLPTALMALRRLQLTSMQNTTSLPNINYLAAYSSPADLRDAIDGDLAPWIDRASRITRYEPAVIAKFLYSATDGPGDFSRFINFLDQKQWPRHIETSLDQTFNDCPPRMVLSQIQLISSFNVETQWEDLRGLVTPSTTKFIYCSPSNYDRTVNNDAAIQKYKNALQRLSVPTTILDTGPSGHANTFASAVAIGSLIGMSSQPLSRITDNAG